MDFQSELLKDLATADVQELWNKFVTRLEQCKNKISLQGKLAQLMAFNG